MEKQWLEKIGNTTTLDELEVLRVDIFGKKGYLTLEFAKMRDIPNEQKKEFASNLNKQKASLNKRYEEKKTILMAEALEKELKSQKIDLSTFSAKKTSGATHPVQETMDRIIRYFQNLNFF